MLMIGEAKWLKNDLSYFLCMPRWFVVNTLLPFKGPIYLIYFITAVSDGGPSLNLLLLFSQTLPAIRLSCKIAYH